MAHDIPAASMAGFSAAEAFLANAGCDECHACKCSPRSGEQCSHYVCLNRPAYATVTCPVALAAAQVERAATYSYIRQHDC